MRQINITGPSALGGCQLRFLYSTTMLPPAEALRRVTVAGDLVQFNTLARTTQAAGRSAAALSLRH